MKKILALVVLGCMAMAPHLSASPTPPDPELWVMDADGTDQRQLGDREAGLDGYGNFSWAPDSTRIVASGLAVVDVATGQVTRLDSGGEPDWSPVSDEIVFGADGLHVVRPDGSERRLLVPSPASDPAWSPDGTQVAYVAGQGSGKPGQVFVVDADGTDARQVSTAGSLYIAPVWSPDGRQLAFETFDYDLHLVNVDGTGEGPVGDYEYSNDPTWCPDGTLYFTGEAPGDERAGIYSVTPGGSHERVAEGANPDCSSTGRLAFSRDGDVYVMDPGQNGTPNLTVSADRSDFQVKWSPDSSKIAFVSLPDRSDPVPVEREVGLSLGGHVVARGRVRPVDQRCFTSVEVQRITRDGWKTLRTPDPDPEGRFRARLPDRPGLYRAVAPRHPSPFGEYDCLRAVSEIVRHRH